VIRALAVAMVAIVLRWMLGSACLGFVFRRKAGAVHLPVWRCERASLATALAFAGVQRFRWWFAVLMLAAALPLFSLLRSLRCGAKGHECQQRNAACAAYQVLGVRHGLILS
jgi:hypothetical protein